MGSEGLKITSVLTNPSDFYAAGIPAAFQFVGFAQHSLKKTTLYFSRHRYQLETIENI